MHFIKYVVGLIYLPNYALSELVCEATVPEISWTGDGISNNSGIVGSNGDHNKNKKFFHGHSEKKNKTHDNLGSAIGCCPNEIDGQRYFEDQGCCCGQIYDTTTEFCCTSDTSPCGGNYQDSPMPSTEAGECNCVSDCVEDTKKEANTTEVTGATVNWIPTSTGLAVPNITLSKFYSLEFDIRFKSSPIIHYDIYQFMSIYSDNFASHPMLRMYIQDAYSIDNYDDSSVNFYWEQLLDNNVDTVVLKIQFSQCMANGKINARDVGPFVKIILELNKIYHVKVETTERIISGYATGNVKISFGSYSTTYTFATADKSNNYNGPLYFCDSTNDTKGDIYVFKPYSDEHAADAELSNIVFT